MVVGCLAKKLNTTDTNGDETRVRKMPVNLNMTECVFKQIENPRFPDFRFSEAMNYIPSDITFRRLYEFYRKKSAMMHNDDLKPLTYKGSRKIQNEYERLKRYYVELLEK